MTFVKGKRQTRCFSGKICEKNQSFNIRQEMKKKEEKGKYNHNLEDLIRAKS